MKNTTREEEYDLDSQTTSETELHELFLDALAEVLNAEQQLTKALPRMAGMATSTYLGEAIEAHLAETENHITRLEEVFLLLDEPVQNRLCKVMKILIGESDELMDTMNNSLVMDASLIATARKIEHHEIACYESLCTWADSLGFEEAVELLDAILEEEKAADELLITISRRLSGGTGY